jgi:hypothetical protein
MEDKVVAEFPERLQGIADSATSRVSVALVQHTGARLPPALMDDIRSFLELAVRAAAFEGARCHQAAGKALTEGRLSSDKLFGKLTQVSVPRKAPKGPW